jgi:hypothetical protein
MDQLDPANDDRGPSQRAKQSGAPHVPPRRESLKIGREPFDPEPGAACAEVRVCRAGLRPFGRYARIWSLKR